jgi:exopolysaccharide production protein ExoQ
VKVRRRNEASRIGAGASGSPHKPTMLQQYRPGDDGERDVGNVSAPVPHLSYALLASAFGIASAPFPFSGPILVAVCAALSFTCLLRIGRTARLGKPLTAFVIWCAFSTLWSVAPSLTLDGTIQLIVLVAAGTFSVQRLGVDRAINACALAARIVLSLSWLFYFAIPASGRTQGVNHAGSFKGVFLDRNSAAFSIIVFLVLFLCAHRLRTTATGRLSATFWSLLSAASVVLTESGTGLVMLAVAITVFLVIRALPQRSRSGRRTLLITAGCALVVTIVWTTTHLTDVAVLLGRDSTLTGRTVIWAVIERHLPDVRYQGYGWDALWNAGVPATDFMWAEANFRFYHAHQAYLDYMAQVGIVGLTLMLCAVGVAMRHSIKSDASQATVTAPLVITMLVTLLCYGATELSFASDFGILVVAICTGAANSNYARTV